MLLKRGGGAECCLRHCTTRRTVSYKASGPDASGMYDASYSVVQGVGARRVGDVRRVGRCRGPTRRKIPISTVVTVCQPLFMAGGEWDAHNLLD